MRYDGTKIKGGLRTKGHLKKSTPGNPLISIITVVFNGEKYLEQTIRSVISQDYANIEYIVIDGLSTDGTLEIIKKYEDKIDCWISEPDHGIYDAMNKGITEAKGEIIGIINSDDYYIEGAVREVVEAAVREPEAGGFHGNLMFERRKGRTEKWCSKSRFDASDAYHMPVNHPTVFIRSVYYKKYGMFNLKYRIVADYDLILRYLFYHDVKFCYLDKTLVYMREGGESGNFSWNDYHDVIEILTKLNFSLAIIIRARIKYLLYILMLSINKGLN